MFGRAAASQIASASATSSLFGFTYARRRTQASDRLRAGVSESELAARVASNPSDLETRLSLAGALAARKAWRESMDELLDIIRRNKSWRDGEARRQMLAIFNLAAGQPDLVSEYRRKLASVLN